jgi:predicted nucleotidyltransferase
MKKVVLISIISCNILFGSNYDLNKNQNKTLITDNTNGTHLLENKPIWENNLAWQDEEYTDNEKEAYLNNDNSDVDILYHLEDSFLNNNLGFIGFKKLDEIKSFISKDIGLKVDFAPKNNLSKTAQKYILKDVIYV